MLQPGDTVVAYTDGVTEARHGNDFFGEQRLHDFLRRTSDDQPAETIASGLLDEVVQFQHGFTRDDIAILVVRPRLTSTAAHETTGSDLVDRVLAVRCEIL